MCSLIHFWLDLLAGGYMDMLVPDAFLHKNSTTRLLGQFVIEENYSRPPHVQIYSQLFYCLSNDYWNDSKMSIRCLIWHKRKLVMACKKGTFLWTFHTAVFTKNFKVHSFTSGKNMDFYEIGAYKISEYFIKANFRKNFSQHNIFLFLPTTRQFVLFSTNISDDSES